MKTKKIKATKSKRKFKEKFLFICLIVLASVILIFSFIFLSYPPKIEINPELASCIGSNSTFYFLAGCLHCVSQKELFGDNFQYLNVIDCGENPDKCLNITTVPTWIINEKIYEGKKSIEELKELTGC